MNWKDDGRGAFYAVEVPEWKPPREVPAAADVDKKVQELKTWFLAADVWWQRHTAALRENRELKAQLRAQQRRVR